MLEEVDKLDGGLRGEQLRLIQLREETSVRSALRL